MNFKSHLILIAFLLIGNCNAYTQMWSPSAPTLIGPEEGFRYGQEIDMSRDGTRMTVLSGGSTGISPVNINGSVQTYDLIDGEWIEMGELLTGDNPGDGSFLKIGSLSNSGYVKVFDYINNAWVQRGETLFGQDGYYITSAFATDISINYDGNIIAIGDMNYEVSPPGGFGDPGVYAGVVRAHEWNGSAWQTKGDFIFEISENDWTGISVSLSAEGNRMAIGSPLEDMPAENAGLIRIFDWQDSEWQLTGEITGEEQSDNFGRKFEISEDGNVILGLILTEPSDFWKVFEDSGTSWTQRGDDFYDSTEVLEGMNVTINEDGSIIAVASPTDGSAFISNTGQIDSYLWNGNQWTDLDIDIFGGNEQYGNWGHDIKLSGNGSQLIVSAFNESENDTILGKIYTYVNSLFDHIQETKIEGAPTFYPNPSFGELWIDLNAQKASHVEVYSTEGRLLINRELNANLEVIQLELESGNYMVRIFLNNSTQSYSRCIIVE